MVQDSSAGASSPPSPSVPGSGRTSPSLSPPPDSSGSDSPPSSVGSPTTGGAEDSPPQPTKVQARATTIQRLFFRTTRDDIPLSSCGPGICTRCVLADCRLLHWRTLSPSHLPTSTSQGPSERWPCSPRGREVPFPAWQTGPRRDERMPRPAW